MTAAVLLEEVPVPAAYLEFQALLGRPPRQDGGDVFQREGPQVDYRPSFLRAWLTVIVRPPNSIPESSAMALSAAALSTSMKE
jgi:hypothetical protein